VFIAETGQPLALLATGLTSPEYTAINLTPGIIYDFKVQSRNSYDYSDYSVVLTMLCAFKPEPPAAPTTYRITNQMYIDWEEPFTNGSPITGYRIFVLQHDKVTYTEVPVECDGYSTEAIESQICTVALDTLIVEPWSLVMNEEVWA
jgi:hypothetical protein